MGPLHPYILILGLLRHKDVNNRYIATRWKLRKQIVKANILFSYVIIKSKLPM